MIGEAPAKGTAIDMKETEIEIEIEIETFIEETVTPTIEEEEDMATEDQSLAGEDIRENVTEEETPGEGTETTTAGTLLLTNANEMTGMIVIEDTAEIEVVKSLKMTLLPDLLRKAMDLRDYMMVRSNPSNNFSHSFKTKILHLLKLSAVMRSTNASTNATSSSPSSPNTKMKHGSGRNTSQMQSKSTESWKRRWPRPDQKLLLQKSLL